MIFKLSMNVWTVFIFLISNETWIKTTVNCPLYNNQNGRRSIKCWWVWELQFSGDNRSKIQKWFNNIFVNWIHKFIFYEFSWLSYNSVTSVFGLYSKKNSCMCLYAKIHLQDIYNTIYEQTKAINRTIKWWTIFMVAEHYTAMEVIRL